MDWPNILSEICTVSSQLICTISSHHFTGLQSEALLRFAHCEADQRPRRRVMTAVSMDAAPAAPPAPDRRAAARVVLVVLAVVAVLVDLSLTTVLDGWAGLAAVAVVVVGLWVTGLVRSTP